MGQGLGEGSHSDPSLGRWNWHPCPLKIYPSKRDTFASFPRVRIRGRRMSQSPWNMSPLTDPPNHLVSVKSDMSSKKSNNECTRRVDWISGFVDEGTGTRLPHVQQEVRIRGGTKDPRAATCKQGEWTVRVRGVWTDVLPAIGAGQSRTSPHPGKALLL